MNNKSQFNDEFANWCNTQPEKKIEKIIIFRWHYDDI